MLKKRLIPCLLVKGGRCVKGAQFSNFRDTGHPVTNARIYDSQGADELLILDIEATAQMRPPNIDLVGKAASECFMPVCAGGGVRTTEDFRSLLLAGADKVAINSAAVENPGLISEAAGIYGSQCVVVCMDVKKSGNRYEVYTHNGTRATGLDPLQWAMEAVSLGAGELLVTSIDREGQMMGYDLELTRMVADAVDAPVIASGGAGTLQHLVDGIDEGHASAVSCGSILHFTDQSIIKAKAYMKNAGLDVRHFKWWR